MVIHGSKMMYLEDKSVNNHPKQTVNHHGLDTRRAPTTTTLRWSHIGFSRRVQLPNKRARRSKRRAQRAASEGTACRAPTSTKPLTKIWIWYDRRAIFEPYLSRESSWKPIVLNVKKKEKLLRPSLGLPAVARP